MIAWRRYRLLEGIVGGGLTQDCPIVDALAVR
jgi:hypothetical protein